MPSKPTKLPRWATAPLAGSVTEPFEGPGTGYPNKDNGWLPGRLRRQILNWWMNNTYEWISWLSSRVFRTTPLFPDQALAGGTAPVAGAGLTQAAGSFSGAVFAGGYQVPLTTGPAADTVYGASTTTYWDLSSDGVWTATVGALTANSTRVYGVQTDATNRIIVLDYRLSRIRFSGGLDFDADQRYGRRQIDTDANAALFRRTMPHRLGGTGFVAVEDFAGMTGIGDITGLGFRTYIWEADASLIAVRGAHYDGVAGNWVYEGAQKVEFLSIRAGAMTARIIDTAITGTTFSTAIALTTAPNGSNGIETALKVQGAVKGGAGLTDSAYDRLEAPRLATVPNANPIRRVLDVDLDYLKIYHLTGATLGVGAGIGGNSAGGEIVSNCRIDSVTGKYNVLQAGLNAYKLELGNYGLRLFLHSAGSPSPWDDVIGADHWRLVEHSQYSNTQYHNQSFMPGGFIPIGVPAVARYGALPTSSAWGTVGLPLATATVDVALVLPIDFPWSANGSVIQACTIFGSTGANSLRVALVRKNIYTNVTVPLKIPSAPDFGWTTIASSLPWGPKSVTIDESQAYRTIDLSVYSYSLVGYCPFTEPNPVFDFATCQIACTILS